MVQFYKGPGSRKFGDKKARARNHPNESLIFVDVLDQHGQGIALSTKPITVIDGALPKETVSVSISVVSKNFRRAKVSKVQKPSEHRIPAICPVYDSCGGCNLQIINAELGLALKRDALMRYFDTMLEIEPDVWKPSILSEIDYSNSQVNIGYRRKVKLAVDARQLGQVKIGYRQNQSNKVVDISSCPILHPQLRQKVERLLPMLKAVGCIHKVGHFECIQSKDGVILIVNLSNPLSSPDLAIFDQLSEATQVRIICRFKEQILLDCGQAFASLAIEDIPGVLLDIAAHHFIQVNASVNQQMIHQAMLWLAPNKQSVVRDFFCGLGNFSLPLAMHSKKVIGYEVSESMIDQAKHNANINVLGNAYFQAIDLSAPEQLETLKIERTDLVLLDPSRDGAQALCELLIKQVPARIVYVSCNPNTLVRDLKILSTRYKVKALNVLDMFPFTQHLETMTLLALK